MGLLASRESMSYITLVTGPTVEPLSDADVKLGLRVKTATESDTVTRLIAASRGMAEEYLTRRLINSTWELVLPRFPGNSDEPLILPYPPLSSVTSVIYRDTDGTATTWSSSKYTVIDPKGANAEPGSVVPNNGETYPATQQRIDAVTVRYIAGYGSAETDVPKDIQTGMHLLVGHLFQNREAVATGGGVPKIIPLGVYALWDKYISEY